MDATSASRTTQSDQASHDETPLDIIKSGWHIFRGPPDYTHTSLPYIYEQTYYSDAVNFAEFAFRLTSPYNPHIGSDYLDINSGAGTQHIYRSQTYAGDAKNIYDNVQFFDFYAGMYNYYSVLSVRYHIVVENLTAEKIYVHIMNFNQEKPPENASNHDMLLWKGCTSYLSTPHGVFIDGSDSLVRHADNVDHVIEEDATLDNTGNASSVADWGLSRNRNSAVITHSAQYNAGQYRREIALDSDINTWTDTSASPAYPERLLIRVRRYDDAIPPDAGNAINYDKPLRFNFKIQAEFLTEFKELKNGLRYPVKRNPLTVSINTEGGTN